MVSVIGLETQATIYVVSTFPKSSIRKIHAVSFPISTAVKSTQYANGSIENITYSPD